MHTRSTQLLLRLLCSLVPFGILLIIRGAALDHPTWMELAIFVEPSLVVIVVVVTCLRGRRRPNRGGRHRASDPVSWRIDIRAEHSSHATPVALRRERVIARRASTNTIVINLEPIELLRRAIDNFSLLLVSEGLDIRHRSTRDDHGPSQIAATVRLAALSPQVAVFISLKEGCLFENAAVRAVGLVPVQIAQPL